MPASEGQVLGGYRLQELIGRGRLGEVWRAQNVHVDSMYRAIKVMRDELAANAEFRQRFLQEAAYLDALRHENIVQVMGIRDEGGVLFMEMELLEGRTVEQLFEDKPLSVDAAIETVRQVALGVAHAHGEGIVHRRLRPATLFVTTKGKVKLLDLGVAQADEASAPSPDTLPGGTHVAPELIEGGAATVASDVYALGAVLFQVVTGKAPFDTAPTEGADPSLASVQSVRADAPEALNAVVRKAMSKAPADRYAKASELAEELSRLVDASKASAELVERAAVGRRDLNRVSLTPTPRAVTPVSTPDSAPLTPAPAPAPAATPPPEPATPASTAPAVVAASTSKPKAVEDVVVPPKSRSRYAIPLILGVVVGGTALFLVIRAWQAPKVTAGPPVITPPPQVATPTPPPQVTQCPTGQTRVGDKCVAEKKKHTVKSMVSAVTHGLLGERLHVGAPGFDDDEGMTSHTIDKDSLSRFVKSRLRSIQSCYERELKLSPSLHGKVVVHFTVRTNGRIGDPGIESDSMRSSSVSSCIVTMVRTWNSPFRPSQDTPVSFPFVFQPGG